MIQAVKQKKYLWYKKRMRIVRVLFGIMMTANVVMFSLHLAALIKISKSFQGDDHYKCFISYYYNQKVVKTVEKCYHGARIILLLLVIISLLKSTVLILRGISKGSEIR